MYEHDIALGEVYKPWIFFINEVFYFLKIMAAEWRRKKQDWRCHFKEKMSQEEVYHHRKVMNKSLKVGEDEWRERERMDRKLDLWRCTYKLLLSNEFHPNLHMWTDLHMLLNLCDHTLRKCWNCRVHLHHSMLSTPH